MRRIKEINRQIKKLVEEKISILTNINSFSGVPFHLHQIILEKTGEDFLPGCGCHDMMMQMQEWGIDGCKEHIEEIVDKMQSEGKKRGLKNKIKASIPIVSREIMKGWVREAIARAEREDAIRKAEATS